MVGRVCQVEVISRNRGGGCLRALVGLLAASFLALYVLLNMQSLVSCLLPFAVVGVLLWMLLSWIGLSGIFGRMVFGGAAIAASAAGGAAVGGRGNRRTVPVLAFGIAPLGDRGTQRMDVHLPGHQTGVGVGDEVHVVGFRWNGLVQAVVVQNRSNGRTMYRAGIFMLAVNIAVIICLVIAVLSAMSQLNGGG